MKQPNNICKFISNTSDEQVYTTNFVFEKNHSEEKSVKMPKNNIVYLVVSGKGKLITESSVKEIKAGNIFFTFAQVPYKIENTDNISYMYITFNGARSEELFSRFNITPNNCLFEGHEGLTSFWQTAIIKAGQKNLDLISEAVLLYTFGEMAPSENNDEQHLLGNILKHIEDNFTDSDLNLNVVAENLGYNSKYVSRIFKDSMGITFSAYLTNVRIQHATFLIEQGVTAIKNVSILSGYKDPFYFSSVFKKAIGMSPSEYISNIKNSTK